MRLDADLEHVVRLHIETDRQLQRFRIGYVPCKKEFRHQQRSWQEGLSRAAATAHIQANTLGLPPSDVADYKLDAVLRKAMEISPYVAYATRALLEQGRAVLPPPAAPITNAAGTAALSPMAPDPLEAHSPVVQPSLRPPPLPAPMPAETPGTLPVPAAASRRPDPSACPQPVGSCETARPDKPRRPTKPLVYASQAEKDRYTADWAVYEAEKLAYKRARIARNTRLSRANKAQKNAESANLQPAAQPPAAQDFGTVTIEIVVPAHLKPGDPIGCRLPNGMLHTAVVPGGALPGSKVQFVLWVTSDGLVELAVLHNSTLITPAQRTPTAGARVKPEPRLDEQPPPMPADARVKLEEQPPPMPADARVKLEFV